MRIAQVSPLYESVPPSTYGGTERVVSYLTEELVHMGHDVTLFAAGDSQTAAKLVPCCERSLRTDPSCADPLVHHILMLDRVFREAHAFDILHFHTDYLHFPLSRRLRRRHVTTLHGRLDMPDLQPLYREFSDIPIVSISFAQRTPLPSANWKATVYHGLPENLYGAHARQGGYLAFLGRVSPEKGLDRAIEIARRVGMPLRVAAKIERVDRPYFESVIEPLFSDPIVEYLGEIGEHEKEELLGGAYAMLFPINWPEPFGLVMTEALACGTPIVAWRHGSVPEILTDGVTGFIVDSIDKAVAAVEKVVTLDRNACRREFERRFSAPRMAADYVALYRRLCEDGSVSALVA